MPVVVPSLNTGQAVRLQVPANLAAHPRAGKQDLDARPNSLQLEPVDRFGDDILSPSCQRPHADGLLAGCGRDRELTLALQECEVGRCQLQKWDG